MPQTVRSCQAAATRGYAGAGDCHSHISRVAELDNQHQSRRPRLQPRRQNTSTPALYPCRTPATGPGPRPEGNSPLGCRPHPQFGVGIQRGPSVPA